MASDPASVDFVGQTDASAITSPGQALWNQRENVAKLRPRLQQLIEAVGRVGDLSPPQWAQILAFTLDFRPDLVLELGRGFGNSTCCFLEAASQLGGAIACKVISFDTSRKWFEHTIPRLEPIVSAEWLAAGEMEVCDLLTFDFQTVLAQAERPLVFWDAHGFDVAECVLSNVLPHLAGKAHRVLMHDMHDSCYVPAAYKKYADTPLWKGENAEEPILFLGKICSRVAQAISILDFSNRNGVPLHSADESLDELFGRDAAKLAELRSRLGDEFASLVGYWFWFTLQEATGELTFPPFRPVAEAMAGGGGNKEVLKARDGQNGQKSPQHEPDELLISSQHLAWLRDRDRQLAAFEHSLLGRLLQRLRRAREKAAPLGSLRHRVYDGLSRLFRE